MYCVKCGGRLDDNDLFCTACGAKVEDDEEEVVAGYESVASTSNNDIQGVNEEVTRLGQIEYYEAPARDTYDKSVEENKPAEDTTVDYVEEPKESPKAKVNQYNSHPTQSKVYVGNKKYVSMDAIKNSNLTKAVDEEASESENAEVTEKAGKTKKKSKPVGGGNKQQTIIIAAIVIVALLIVGVGAVAFFTLKDKLFGNADEPVIEEVVETVEEPEIAEEEVPESTDDQNEVSDEGTDETPDENVTNETSDGEGADPEVGEGSFDDVESDEGSSDELIGTTYEIDGVSLPVGVNVVDANDCMIQIKNNDSGYSVILDCNPDGGNTFDKEHYSSLIQSMIPISYYGNIAILIYDQSDEYPDIDSFAQPFIAKYYPSADDTFALIAEISCDEDTMDYKVYVGGDFSNVIPDNATYGSFMEDMESYGSISKGFVFTFGDWLYDRGIDLLGYSQDHSMYSVVINQGPLKIREFPTSESDVVGLIDAGTIVPVYNENEEWLFVKTYDEYGWVKAEYCDK